MIAAASASAQAAAKRRQRMASRACLLATTTGSLFDSLTLQLADRTACGNRGAARMAVSDDAEPYRYRIRMHSAPGDPLPTRAERHIDQSGLKPDHATTGAATRNERCCLVGRVAGVVPWRRATPAVRAIRSADGAHDGRRLGFVTSPCV